MLFATNKITIKQQIKSGFYFGLTLHFHFFGSFSFYKPLCFPSGNPLLYLSLTVKTITERYIQMDLRKVYVF